MVESGSEPTVHAVALFAGRGKIRGHMARPRRGLIILRVARVALRGHGAVLRSG
jgi:hypothetical protein